MKPEPHRREDGFAASGLHVWGWRASPEGLSAESNPRIDREAE